MRNNNPIPCDIGEFSLEGSTSCRLCPVGQSCTTSNISPRSCLIGEFSNGTHCLPCFRGFSCHSPLVSPVPCSDGLYSDTEGAVSCQICPSGHQCIEKGVSPLICPPGFFSLAGEDKCLVRNILMYVLYWRICVYTLISFTCNT